MRYKISLFCFCFIAASFSFAQVESLYDQKISRTQLQSQNASQVYEALQTAENNDDILLPNLQIAMSSADYIVTAGDIYSLNYAAGTTPVSYKIAVDPTYKIRVANLGVLDAKEKTFLELKNQVELLVMKNYPMSGVQFVLVNPASFNVVVAGEVKNACEKRAWALTRLSSVVKDCFTEYSSERNIEIVSEDGGIKKCDLFKASRYGDFENDPYLRPGQKVIVHRAERKVTVSGAVERPGCYELLKGENLKELVETYCSGLAPFADSSRIQLTRIFSDSVKTGTVVYLDKKQLDENFVLAHYDSINVPTYSDLKPSVFIEGAILSEADSSPGLSRKINLVYSDGKTYGSFIQENKAIFSSESDLQNAYIRRSDDVIPIDINKILYDENFVCLEKLLRNDVLVIPFKQYFVTVSGAVRNPGRYPYIPNRDWQYYVALAGGFVKTQNSWEKIVIKDIYGIKHDKKDAIAPEMTIEASYNSGLYYFNQYAPVVTTILSAISVSLSVLAVTGVF